MSIRYNYNRQISPPAPFVHLTLSRPGGSAASVNSVSAQIDTAADITVIPQRLVDELNLVQLDQITVGGFGGHLTVVPTYIVEIAIHHLTSVATRVLATLDEPCVLLGRDVLNRHRLMLDGPNLVLELQ